MIKALLYKDYRGMVNSLKGSKIYYLFLALIYVAFLVFSDVSQATMILNIFLFTLLITSFNLDVDSNCEAYLSASPVLKNTVVSSKFMILFISGMLALLINSIVFIIVKNLRGYVMDDYIGVLASQLAISAIYSIYIPIIFKYGNKKSMIPFLLTIGVVVGAFVFIIFAIRKIFPSFAPSDIFIMLGLVGLLAGVLVISYMVAIRVLKNKEY
ncbi:ABC-2 family transporter protein [Anaerosphaera aminiphila DSM 21120]|uniref:ABC-2 family transporter protein n=1 Tax=Anaerosphaera aminiphila DSM 21120 TaxID=1120995 RepID=A0A1M5UQH6_9FIRM|nr:ABC-2 transporter permease [Anaerosphaera aminiphila]SHH65332.1 ABC-2 family transporter protein [Anaerosphaera aminiphila DSM 21120]